jgi:2-polyprenyl-3-methyl-5-hydroxy-6-metoxy-1,4-benzoquinol methylase
MATYKKNNVSCSNCGSIRHDVFLEPIINESSPAVLYGAASGIRGAQRLVTCLDCGLIYESPRYPAEVIVKGYMASEEEGHDSQYRMRVLSFYRALKKNGKYLPLPGTKVLDIGTAGGAFLDAAKEFGFDAYGMEPSMDLVERGKARGLKIEQGTIDSHSFAAHSFDMVSLWDVLEHLPDPKAALIEIRNLLKPNGVLLINFPDIGTWQSKIAGKKFWWILSVHLHHFSKTTIRDICRRTGFEAFHFQRYWQTLEFGYLERMAVHYKIPCTSLITKLTPQVIQRIRIPYYASQTTAIARLIS